MKGGRSFRDDFLLIVITAVLAFLGGAGGSYLTNAFENLKWDRETRRANAKAYFEKRLQLIERTTKDLNTGLTTDIIAVSARC